MLTDSKSPKSTYLQLLATIWLTVSTGCWSSGRDGTLATKELSLSGTGTETPTVIEVLKIGERRVLKVATKDGTVKLGLDLRTC